MDMGKSMSVFWCAVVTGMAAIACALCGMGVQSAYAADASALPEIAPTANVIAPAAGYSPAGSAFENAPAQASGQPKIIPIKLGKAFKLYYYTGGVKLLRTASVKNLKTVKKGKNKLITFKVTLKDKMVTKKQARAMNKGVKKGIETVEPVWDVRDLRTGEYIYDVVKASRPLQGEREHWRTVLDAQRQRGAEYFILACTELPILADTLDVPGPFVDPTEELAAAAVRFCSE